MLIYPVGSCIVAPAEITLLTTETPSTSVTDGPGATYEGGMRFSSTISGKIVAIRLWKILGDSSTHVGKVWDTSGTLLTSVTFTGETSSGWQRQNLTTPLNIAANTDYIVSTNSSSEQPYPITPGFFASSLTNQNLTASIGAGVYAVGEGSFPNLTSNNNFFRDIVFTP